MISVIDKKVNNLQLLMPSPCCNRINKAEIIREQSYYYMVSNCKYHNRVTKQILWKDGIGLFPIVDEKVSDYPHYLIQEGQSLNQITEKDVAKLSNLQNILFVLTQRCNSRCRICYDKDEVKRGELDIKLIKNKLKLFKNKHVYLYGGEPTVREDLPYIIKLVRDSSNIPCLFTNGLKLANIDYLNQLLENGLSYVHFTFDGFREDIYEIIRGGEEEYELKLKALENLKKNDVPTVIQFTVVRNVNEAQIYNIIEYARNNKFIYEVLFKPLFLGSAALRAGFTREHLFSPYEINSLISQAVDLPVDYFKVYYRAKIKMRYLLKKSLPFCRINMPFPHQLILYRNGLRPIFRLEELNKINSTLRIIPMISLIKNKNIGYLLYSLLKNKLDLSLMEYSLAKQGKILKISTVLFRPVIFAGENFSPALPMLWFTPKNVIVAYGP